MVHVVDTARNNLVIVKSYQCCEGWLDDKNNSGIDMRDIRAIPREREQ